MRDISGCIAAIFLEFASRLGFLAGDILDLALGAVAKGSRPSPPPTRGYCSQRPSPRILAGRIRVRKVTISTIYSVRSGHVSLHSNTGLPLLCILAPSLPSFRSMSYL